MRARPVVLEDWLRRAVWDTRRVWLSFTALLVAVTALVALIGVGPR
jgi:hypothetical protein